MKIHFTTRPTLLPRGFAFGFALASIALCIPADAATCTWTGGSSSSSQWNYLANWDSAGVPQNGDDVVFPTGAARLVNTNIYTDRRFNSITFSGDGYVVRGNSITVSNGITSTASSTVNTLELDVTLGASQSFQCSYNSSDLYVNGDVDLGSYTLSTLGAGRVRLAGVISGTGGLTKNGSGTHYLQGPSLNSYTGPTVVNSGTLMLAKSGGNAILYGELTIGNNVGSPNTVIVREQGDYQIGNIPITINSDGWLDVDDYYDTVGAISFNGGHASSLAGTLALGGNVTVNASSSVATIGGQLYLGTVTRTFDVANGSATPDLDLKAQISGAGGLVKTGSGLLRLLGANTYTGATTINQGNVYVSNDNAFGSTANGTTVTDTGSIQLTGVDVGNESLTLEKSDSIGSALTASGLSSWAGPVTLNTNVVFSTGGTLDFSGIISGPGGFTKKGGGEMRLIGTLANTYLGTTRVDQGTLYLSTVGGAINHGQLIIGDEAGTDPASVFERSPDQIGTIPVTINSSGDLLMDDYVSDTIGALTLNGGVVNVTIGTLTLGGNLTVLYNADHQASIGGIGALELTTTRTFNVANSPFSPDLQIYLAMSGAGGFTKTGNGAVGLHAASTFSGVATVNDGLVYVYHDDALGATTAGTVVGSGGVLVLANSRTVDAEPLTLNGSGDGISGALASIGGSNTWTATVTLATDAVITVQTNQFLNLAGRVEGPAGFIKAQPGSLILSGSNNNVYTGPTLVADGTLLMDKTSPYWAIGYGSLTVGDGSGAEGSARARELGNYQLGPIPLTVNEDGLFDLNNFDDTLGNSLTLNEGGEVQTGTGTLSLGADSMITCSASSSTIHSSISGRLNVGSGTCTFDISSGRLDIPAALNGSADIRITAPTAFGGMYLWASNSFSGTLTVENSSILWVGDAWALGDTTGNTMVNDSAYLGFPGGIHVAAEPLTLNSHYPYGVIWVNGSEGGGSNSWSGPVTLSRETTVDFFPGPAYMFNFTGPISGPGGLTKKGEDGVLILSGSSANTYAGDTVVSEGTLVLEKTLADGAVPGPLVIGDGTGDADADVVRLKRSNQIANTADVTIASSGLFDLGGYYDRMNAVTGSGSIMLGSGYLIAGHSGSSFIFDGLVSGSGYLWKIGAGTWTLTANNTYSGTTRIETGTLIVNGSQPGSDVLVQPGGTLKGTGTVGDVNSQGTVAPGSSPGQLHAGDSGLSSDSTLAIELNGPVLGSGYDQLDVAGAADVTGASLAVSLGYLPAVGDSFVVLNNDGADAVSGTFAGLADGASLTASNVTLVIDYTGGTGNDVMLSVTNVTEVTSLRFTSVEAAGSDVALSWEGGAPFYVLEKKSALTDADWQPVTPPMRETETNLPMTAPAGFYRVKGWN